MARLEDKIAEIRNAELRQTIAAEVCELKDLLKKGRRFGLVFEEHLPELLPIYSAKIRSHARVARKDGRLTETFIVERVAKGVATVKPEQGDGEPQNIPVADLVVVKRFGEAIFPALRHVESVLRGGDAPHHTLIEADNYHALQLFEWLYTGKVDCIYVDPPYNTGARDWKYNNDYVDKSDGWRHSKWLSMMSRRLKLASRLLHPTRGVLIVTIDEHEVHHLGMLLEHVFPQAVRQMATIVINAKGVAQGRLARTEEYAMYVFMPDAYVKTYHDDLLSQDRTANGDEPTPRWERLLRGGSNSRREDREKLFYPIFIDPKRGTIKAVGEYLPLKKAPDMTGASDGYVAWPIRSNGSLGNWQVSPESIRPLIEKGFVKLGGFDKNRNTWTVLYLNRGTRARIDNGAIRIVGRDQKTGTVEIEYADAEARQRNIKTVWHRKTHDAGIYGSNVLRSIIGGETKFSFPKSIYATRDAVAAVVRDRPNALVLDFFAGSGTTLNAVMLLNAADNGNRRCILVTNNEVSDDAVRDLKTRGLEAGQPNWEQHGICRSVTFPRCKFAISGRRSDGTEIEGEYLTGRFEEREVRRAIRSLDFAPVKTLASTKAREALAVAVNFTKSKVTGDESFLIGEGEKVAVLLDPERLTAFIEQGAEWAEGIDTVYLPFPAGKEFNQAKEQLTEAWPPLTKSVEIRRPIKEGFAANLDYFRLDFLDRAQVETGGKLADILPALWMMAGCRGKLPTCRGKEKMLFFKDCPFAMLVEESAINPFLAKLEERPDIDWVFLVTNDQDSFSRMCEWLPEQVPAMQRIHLWRNYVDNFLINVDRTAGETP